MDPAAALRRALRALQSCDKREARDALNDYWGWRSRGGFQPRGGDTKARHLAKRVRRKKCGRIAGLGKICRFGRVKSGARKGLCKKR